MSIGRVLMGLAILIMLACVAVLIIKPVQSGDFPEFWQTIAWSVLFIVGLSLGIGVLNKRSVKKADLYRAKVAEEKVVEEEQKAAEEARLQALPKLINCPACNKEISREAVFCPSCGHPINPAVQVQAPSVQAPPQRSWSPGVAALLSLIIPGAGQMYKGQVGAGLLWLIFVVGGYFLFIIPGVILHLICIFSAASEKK
jgi:hypothetical protein